METDVAIRIYYTTCPACLGTGMIKIKYSSFEDDTCSITVVSYSEEPCENCEGTGQIEVEY